MPLETSLSNTDINGFETLFFVSKHNDIIELENDFQLTTHEN